MTDLEAVTERLAAIRGGDAATLHDDFAALTFRFRFVPAEDRRRLAAEFMTWGNRPGATPTQAAVALFLLALTHFLADDFRPALQHLSRARAIAVEQGDEMWRGMCSMLIGGIYRTFGNYDLAIKTALEGFELLRASGRYPMFAAASANTLAGIHFDRRELDEAARMYETTLAESIRADDFYFMIYALHGAGRVAAEQGRLADAERSLTRALDLARKHEHALHTANSLTELAALRLKTDDLDAALALNQDALGIREARRLLPGAITSLLAIAEIHSRREAFAEAKKALDAAFRHAEQLGVKPKLAQVCLAQALLAHRTGDDRAAFGHYRRYHELREAVEREDGENRIADARAIFESEQTKKENAIIRAQKAEIERQNVELQDTIDELTRARIGRKARAMTLALAIVLFILQDLILRTALSLAGTSNYFVLLGIKMAIIFSLLPINRGIERYLLRRVRSARSTQTFPSASVASPSPG